MSTEKKHKSFSFPAVEEQLLKQWHASNLFHRTLEKHSPKGRYVFYEGPPTANNVPHVGHSLTRAIKDVVLRFFTMRGYFVNRKAGWDTHGLPVEIEMEKRLGLSDKLGILTLKETQEESIAYFNSLCRKSVLEYIGNWEDSSERLGYWLDYSDAYYTFTNRYIESVWWILKQFFDNNLLYKGYKILPYCPLCGTTHSSHEVGQGWQDDVPDPSIFAKMRVMSGQKAGSYAFNDDQPTYLLIWTTTPWTLVSNLAVCAKAEIDYVIVQSVEPKERYILAEALLESCKLSHLEIIWRGKGTDLDGLRYEALFPDVLPSLAAAKDYMSGSEPEGTAPSAYRVVLDNYVTIEDGTGLVHQAPAFGEDDYRVTRREGLPFICAVQGNGEFKPAVVQAHDGQLERVFNSDNCPTPWKKFKLSEVIEHFSWNGRTVKDFRVPNEVEKGKKSVAVDSLIYDELKDRGLVLQVEGKSGLKAYKHAYPFCWRHDTPLIYFATDSWFVKTTAFKQQLLDGNQSVDWKPEHIRDGRMGDWLANVVDWAVSRNRFWGTPLPIWVNDKTGEMKCVGSYAELFELAGKSDEYKQLLANGDLYDHEKFDPHKPFIDNVTWTDASGGTFRRVPEVIDCWFDSGSMPFAQCNYPHYADQHGLDRAEYLAKYYPAEFISEAVDQTRGWFYTLHAIAVFLEHYLPEIKKVAEINHKADEPLGVSYKHCIVLGHVLDETGKKMSKRLGNVIEPADIFSKYGADAFRWYLFAATQPWTPTRFSENAVKETMQQFILPLYNAFSFFKIYAGIDEFDPMHQEWSIYDASLLPIDRWLLSKFTKCKQGVVEALDAYDINGACGHLTKLVDMLNNWWIRRSRRRFWGPGKGLTMQREKWLAYALLYNVLLDLCRLSAPFVPFLADYLWGELAPMSKQANDSVHLETIDDATSEAVYPEIESLMDTALRVVELGRKCRADHKLKVRQPLDRAILVTTNVQLRTELSQLTELIAEELNVKKIELATNPDEFVSYDLKPNFRMLGARLRDQIPVVKQALAQADAGVLYKQLSSSGKCEVAGIELTTEEIEVRLIEKEGTASASSGDLLLVLHTVLSEDLVNEGMARDFVHFIQDQRKHMDFEYTDHIIINIHCVPVASKFITANSKYIMEETLADHLDFVLEQDLGTLEFTDIKIGNYDLKINLVKV